MARRSNAKGVAWIALVIALISLIFSWIAFTRTGTQLNETIEQAVEEEMKTNFQSQPAPSAGTSAPELPTEATGTTPTSTNEEG